MVIRNTGSDLPQELAEEDWKILEYGVPRSAKYIRPEKSRHTEDITEITGTAYTQEYTIWHTPLITMTELHDKFRGDFLSLDFHLPKRLKERLARTIYEQIRTGAYKCQPAYFFREEESEKESYDLTAALRHSDPELSAHSWGEKIASQLAVVHHMHIQPMIAGGAERLAKMGYAVKMMVCIASLERVRPGIAQRILQDYQIKVLQPVRERIKERAKKKKAPNC